MNNTLKRIAILLLVSGVVAVVANTVHPKRIPWVQDWSRHVEAKAAKHKIKVVPLFVALKKFQSLEVVFIDARPVEEFAQGHIPGAASIPFQSLEEHFPALGNLVDSGRELVVYCGNRDCDDSLMLAIELQAMGCDNLVLYVDGFELWEKHGGATEAGEPPAVRVVGGGGDPASGGEEVAE
ncbi:MAG: rhodanese-like domain-containing protein [Verrucomicrobiota bacterium]|nr:rhodanese-like domain-containing protein [Verrucomicrobiota bacterium]